MPNPLRQLKFLPWRSLFLVALLTLAIASLVDGLLAWGSQVALIARALRFFFLPNWALLVSAVVGLGIGALAVLLLERLFSGRVLMHTSTLWALVLCLVVCLWGQSLLPLPRILVSLNEAQAIGIVVGLFWKGRPYWS